MSTRMKTAQEWFFFHLPIDLARRASANTFAEEPSRLRGYYRSIDEALCCSFEWEKTPEGEFWAEVRKAIHIDGAFPVFYSHDEFKETPITKSDLAHIIKGIKIAADILQDQIRILLNEDSPIHDPNFHPVPAIIGLSENFVESANYNISKIREVIYLGSQEKITEYLNEMQCFHDSMKGVDTNQG